MNIKIYWSDSLENLAEALFSGTEDRSDPFSTECTVAGSPLMAGWLKQYFLHDYPKSRNSQKVLACWDFKMLHPFVNDWMAKAAAGTPIGGRDPARHPYSPAVLQWRIWNELSRQDRLESYKTLFEYIGTDEKAVNRKRWGLSGRLGMLFDDYQNYRPDLLKTWEQGMNTGLDDHHLAWQAELWRNLVKDEQETYVKQFVGLQQKLAKCGISNAYRRITVFHTSAMPAAYMHFFVELGKLMPVRMFIFNPSREFWIDDPTVKGHIRELIKNGESLAWLNPPHPVLSGFGRGTQALLGTMLNVTEGSIHEAEWADDNDTTLLHKVQANIRGKGESGIDNAQDDGSIQFHICHGPMREVETARDLIFKWFEEHPGTEPRDIQVLVPDIETYAPFIESVFRVSDNNPAIPCSISKRPAVSAGAVGAAFIKLMKFNESRMTAPEALELLELEPVRERYSLDPDEIQSIRRLVNNAGIRWGRDGAHINKALDNESNSIPDTATWRRGLDRMLTGFAAGRCCDGNDMLEAGRLGAIKIYDEVEGSSAELTGRLAGFYEDLCETADSISEHKSHKVSDWANLYISMLEKFFLGTESTFIELAEIRRGIHSVTKAAEVAGDPETSCDVMAAAIEAELGGMAPAGRSETNAVLFSPMRTMQVTPRRMIIMLGLNEGVFPRTDQRTAFDLLALKPRFGDRSLRQEDRLSFLEALMSARERLIITYTGRNISNNKEIPPSPAVTEFLQYLDSLTEDKHKPLTEKIEHKLHSFNPEYYRTTGKLFSYSKSNHQAALILAGVNDLPIPQSIPIEPHIKVIEEKKQILLDEIVDFFLNPAKHFYTKVLDVRLLDPSRDEVHDSEIFDGDTLDDYNINKVMLNDLLCSSKSQEISDFEPDERYLIRLQEQALIPLGNYGAGRTRQRLLNLRSFVNDGTPCSGWPNLYQALRAVKNSGQTPQIVNAECGNYTVTASLPMIEQGSRNTLLRFRFSSIKPKDIVRAWLAHVTGHAAGITFCTDIAGKKKDKKKEDKIELITLNPISQETAAEILTALLNLYESGRRAILPFAPAASMAYVEEIIKTHEEDAALDKAESAWSGFNATEYKDLYLADAWREAGPMVHPDFGTSARTFWDQCLAQPSSGPAEHTENNDV